MNFFFARDITFFQPQTLLMPRKGQGQHISFRNIGEKYEGVCGVHEKGKKNKKNARVFSHTSDLSLLDIRVLFVKDTHSPPIRVGQCSPRA